MSPDVLTRRSAVALTVLALHVGLMGALLALRVTGRAEPDAGPPLVTVSVPFEARALPPLPQLDGSYWAPPLAAPAIAIPDTPEFPRPPGIEALSGDIGVVGEYVGCGARGDEHMPADQRTRCDELRAPLVARPNGRPAPSAEQLTLERHFEREKLRQDAAVILPCMAFTDVLCVIGTLVTGEEFKIGSYADRAAPENPLAQPVFPFRP